MYYSSQLYFACIYHLTYLYVLYRYYHNKETGATQWERPAELGPAPLATGMYIIHS